MCLFGKSRKSTSLVVWTCSLKYLNKAALGFNCKTIGPLMHLKHTKIGRKTEFLPKTPLRRWLFQFSCQCTNFLLGFFLNHILIILPAMPPSPFNFPLCAYNSFFLRLNLHRKRGHSAFMIMHILFPLSPFLSFVCFILSLHLGKFYHENLTFVRFSKSKSKQFHFKRANQCSN